MPPWNDSTTFQLIIIPLHGLIMLLKRHCSLVGGSRSVVAGQYLEFGQPRAYPANYPTIITRFADVSTEVIRTNSAFFARKSMKESKMEDNCSNDWSYGSRSCCLRQISLPRLQSFHRSAAGHITNHKATRGYIGQTIPDCFPSEPLVSHTTLYLSK